ncbi:amidohydrolase family protein [Thiovibrio frasassiensis]|uniref:Amidohydrolase family protein n=1 Tax=Thiovibrio frasassiensis TaxID=2984131 RepID=A0A9X4RQT9_9BACT|nr:amidohydrolase family protein [Thiovibrio frasassiensis]MDG4476587.1 amidohydrolase family protein [Thiovibrio frasassiensis]
MQEYPRYLYRAPFVVQGNGPIIADGAVLTEDGLVVAVGRYAELKDLDAQLEDYEGHVITPPLVNCHAHLELSYLSGLATAGSDSPSPGDMTGWIRSLLAARAENIEQDTVHDAALMALATLYAGGCRGVADIGNRPESSFLAEGFKTEVLFFLEMFGLCGESEESALAALSGFAADVRCTAHAPYSTGARLIQALKKRAGRERSLFPMHVAESAQEIEFLRTGSGPFRDFLLERGVAVDSFTPPGMGAVRYLDSLGVLDAQTLCVHAVHVDEEEISLLAARGGAVCLCPASNRYMGVGTAPVEKMLAQGIPLVLGTDSLASNPQLNLWQEMQVLRQDHPALAPEAVFAMASVNGSRLLGLGGRLGTVAPGVSSSLLAVRCQAKNEGDVLEYLTSTGTDIKLEWLE